MEEEKLCDYCIYEPDWKLKTKTNVSIVGNCKKIDKKISCWFMSNTTKSFIVESLNYIKIWNSFSECDYFKEKENIRI